MKIEEAIYKSSHNENVQRLKGYFLCSGFTTLTETKKDITEWTLLFYSQKSKTVIDCFVNEKFVTVGESTPAMKDMEEVDAKKLCVDIDDALESVEKKFAGKSINTLISLHMKEFGKKQKLVWTIAMITQGLSATSYDVDAVTGEILGEETTSLIRRE